MTKQANDYKKTNCFDDISKAANKLTISVGENVCDYVKLLVFVA